MTAMTDPAFQAAVAIVLRNEGGFTCDPDDAGNWTGGACGSGRLVGTNFGVSAESYPDLDIPQLTEAQAAQIYFTDWWAKPLPVLAISNLPAGIAWKVLDAAINMGPHTAIRLLQEAMVALGAAVAVDGALGPQTVAATVLTGTAALLASYRAHLAAYYQQLAIDVPEDAQFLHGWLTRAAQ